MEHSESVLDKPLHKASGHEGSGSREGNDNRGGESPSAGSTAPSPFLSGTNTISQAASDLLKKLVEEAVGLDGCLICLRTPSQDYPIIKGIGGAHRFVWTCCNGPIPEGMLVCHTCDTPRCIYIEHLFLGTVDDNMQDKVSKGRQHFGGPGKVLSEEKIAEARRLYDVENWTYEEIGDHFMVSRRTIARALEVKHPSPFLPGTQIQFAWDSTSLGMIKTCPRLYQYIMIEGYQPHGESVHLRFGIEFHHALQQYDIWMATKGITQEDALREVVRDLLIRTRDFDPDRDERAGKYKNRDTLLRLVVDYLDFWQHDPAKTLILEDGRPAVEMSFRFELEWGPMLSSIESSLGHPGQPYLLSGHLDRVVNFNDDLYVMDRKTSLTTLGPYYFNQYEPHNQMTLYTIASQIILGTPVKGVIIDAAQVLLEKENAFRRGTTFRTPDQLEEWMKSLKVLLRQAEEYATAGYWPMNDTACGNYGGCKFREICSKSPQVREAFLKSGFTKLEESARWNPLKPR